jgi:hypothetical protein
MKIIYKNKKGVSLAIAALGMVTILSFAGLVIDTGMILNYRNELQKAVETAALLGASNLEPIKDSDKIYIDTSQIKKIIQETFDYTKTGFLRNAEMKAADNTYCDINAESKTVRVYATVNAPTYFLKFIWIPYVKIQAQAAAMSAPFYLSPDFPKEPVIGSLITDTSADTDIRNPVGDNYNANIDPADFTVNYANIYGFPDNRALHLGPGGYIMLRLPVPLVDRGGFDLYIRELGNLEGYFVFAGTDVNPSNPYINEGTPGDGIEWTNISCTGTPSDISNSTAIGAYKVNVDYLNGMTISLTKFYGSGFFDLDLSCTNDPQNYNGHIKTVKYIKIIDDNSEDGFMADNPNISSLLIGEHSSPTPGADIDSVGVFHHTRLISVRDFNIDSDKDGLIDILEAVIGTDPNKADSDSDTLTDGLEYTGWCYNADGTTIGSIADNKTDTAYFTNPLFADTDYKTARQMLIN